MSRSNYEIVRQDPGRPIVLKDLGPWSKFMTITKDAENVVDELARAGKLPRGRRLFYYDSEGELTELCLMNGKFVGFGPGKPVAEY